MGFKASRSQDIMQIYFPMASYFLCRKFDQIGRIFAQWVIVYFAQLLENYRSIQHFWAPFFHG
jgi:hypothetical protein